MSNCEHQQSRARQVKIGYFEARCERCGALAYGFLSPQGAINALARAGTASGRTDTEDHKEAAG